MAQERLRVIIETDAGGDPDDEQSLVRFLLYSNEWDVEGIIATRPHARDGENLNPQRTGLGIVRAMLTAYGQCYSNLFGHSWAPGFPSPEYLWHHTVPGYEDTPDGVNLILAAVDAPDPRPIWFCNWGTDAGSARSSLQRALDQVRRERGLAGYEKFKRKIRLSSYDKFDQHTTTFMPTFPLWIDTYHPEIEKKRWYHRFSALTAKAGGFDVERDVRTGHGPLGALYPTNTNLPQKEGDSMTFLYLMPTGMNDVNQPTWGSWGGRYGPNETFPGRPYYWADVADTWHGTTSRDNTLARWATALQNDFRARLNWCVAPTADNANRPPMPHCQHDATGKILYVAARAGHPYALDASGSSDPDYGRLHYSWYTYPEAGTYAGAVTIHQANAPVATLDVPADSGGKTIHVLLEVSDDGSPSLTRYRRIVLTGKQG